MDAVPDLAARVTVDGVAGWGEAAPAEAVTAEGPAEAARQLLGWASDGASLETALVEAEARPGGHATPAARSAASSAALDALGRRRGQALHQLLNLPEGRVRSSITLSLGPVAAVLDEAAARDAEGWGLFKVKLGGPEDEAVLRALRDRYPEKGLRVDANEAWSPQVASQRLLALERIGVDYLEQPLPRSLLDESAELAKKTDIPILLDESLHDSSDAIELVAREAGDGGNIKLSKCGGPYEARRIVKVLKTAGWKVMVGCMVESRLGIATAAAFAGAVDYADLDGHALVADDPFTGFETPQGWVDTPQRPGIGVELARGPLEPLHR